MSSLTPSAQVYVIGSTEKTFAKINLTANSGEDMSVSAIMVDPYQAAGPATPCDTSNYLTNMKILKSDGTQYGSTDVIAIASSTFSGTLIVAAGTTETLSVVADIPLTSYPS